MLANQREMHLGVFNIGTGNHVAGWRYPGAGASSEDFPLMRRIGEIAERGKLDFMFLADNPVCMLNDHPGYVVRLEPTTLLGALSVCTSRLGLVATASTTYCEPYNVARVFASIDHLSGGRAGWNVVTTASPEAAANFGRDGTVAHDLRYEIAAEFVEVVQGLWDSWEEGAVLANRDTGEYIDGNKVHTLDHKGRFYSVRGPLNASRCPQGQPVIVQAGSSSSGQQFAARFAEVMFTVQHDLEEARKFYAEVKGKVAACGRSPNHCKILPGIFPIIGASEAEARRKLADLMKYIDSARALKLLSDRCGHDLSQYPLDGPVPDLPLSDRIQSFARVLFARAKRENYTLRDLFHIMAVARGYLVTCGTPKTVADMLQEWFESQAADGFIILPAYFPGPFDEFVEQVVPELQRRGLFREEYRGTTLRGHLGLPEPRNRFMAPVVKPAAAL
jgi:FMN-dependent oxidoreductase (nitrilotriacetate monooxygenase family)